MSASPYLVQVGLMGMVGLYLSPSPQRFPRGSQVICRTDRGLEIGNVICDLDSGVDTKMTVAGQLLRTVTKDDRLIIERLERYRDRAFEACSKLIRQQQWKAHLVEVEHLFDGESVYFYFLGDVPPESESLTEQLGSEYERKVRFKKFAETLANGCGPDCGSPTGSSCSSGGCGSCSLSSKCHSR
jgi:cell fate regulator YaaT (PSP1 superfamily)